VIGALPFNSLNSQILLVKSWLESELEQAPSSRIVIDPMAKIIILFISPFLVKTQD
jgi:hypothetical protein